MKPTIHSETQGSEEWLAGRRTRLNASELVLAAGINMNGRTRTGLIRQVATGIKEEIDPHQQKRFDDGHRFEALALPLAEQILGRALYPITLSAEVDGLKRRLGVSLDGATDDDDINYEHKGLNQELEAAMEQGIIPDEYHWQMEQGQMLNGARRTLFMASKWDDDDNLIKELHLWYNGNPDLRAKIIPIWKQAEADAEAYQHVEAAPVATAAPIKDLPAVVLTVSGALSIETNFEIWGKELQAFIDRLPERVPEKLSTDQEFEDCKAAIAAFKKAEAMLDAEEGRVLSMVTDIEEMQRTKKLMRDLSSTTRLILEKRAARRDGEVKMEIVQEGKTALAAHLNSLNKRLATVQMPAIVADFAAAIKGKKLYSSMREAVATLLAQKKIEANEIADLIQINIGSLYETGDYAFLFSDRATLCMKAPDDLALVIKTRIADRKAEEVKREAEQRERIRAEEEARAAAKVKAEQEAEARKQPVCVVDGTPAFIGEKFYDFFGDEYELSLSQSGIPRFKNKTTTFTLGCEDSLSRTKDGVSKRKAEQEARDKIAAENLAAEKEFSARIATEAEANRAKRTEPAPLPAPDLPMGRLDETAGVAAHKGITGSARLMDRLDDLARQMTERQLSDLCVHAEHILSEGRKAA